MLMLVQPSVSPPLQQLPLRLYSGSSMLSYPILTPIQKRAFFSQLSASFQGSCRLQRGNFRSPKRSFRCSLCPSAIDDNELQKVSYVCHTRETCCIQIFGRKMREFSISAAMRLDDFLNDLLIEEDVTSVERPFICISALSYGSISWLASAQVALASEGDNANAVYEIGELFELGIQLTYLLLLLALLGVGSFFVIRQVLVRRELDLSAKELQEQVRSGDASATELFELGAVMLRRKFYPAATKYLLQAIEKWDGDDQDLAQVYNALGVSYVLDGKVEKGISQFENAVKLQPGYVTAWNNLGDAYEKKKDYKSALKAFEEVMLFDPNNKVARPRRDALKEKVKVYKGVPVKSKKS